MEDRIEELKLAQACFTKAKNEFAKVVGNLLTHFDCFLYFWLMRTMCWWGQCVDVDNILWTYVFDFFPQLYLINVKKFHSRYINYFILKTYYVQEKIDMLCICMVVYTACILYYCRPTFIRDDISRFTGHKLVCDN